MSYADDTTPAAVAAGAVRDLRANAVRLVNGNRPANGRTFHSRSHTQLSS